MRVISRRSPPADGERGSVLALVPAGFLVLMLLGAIAVDNGATYLAQRQLQGTVEAAANDAAASGLSNPAFYDQGTVQISPIEAAAVVCQDIAAQHDGRLRSTSVSLAVEGRTIFVEARAEVPAIFGSLIPGFGLRPVSAEAAAIAAQGPDQVSPALPPSAAFTPLTC